jgi:Family of unknown function (DUF5996)
MRNSAICLRAVGGTLEFDGRPNEVPDLVPFAEDRGERPYDADAVKRFFHATVAVDRVFKLFRTGFLGKVDASINELCQDDRVALIGSCARFCLSDAPAVTAPDGSDCRSNRRDAR